VDIQSQGQVLPIADVFTSQSTMVTITDTSKEVRDGRSLHVNNTLRMNM